LPDSLILSLSDGSRRFGEASLNGAWLLRGRQATNNIKKNHEALA
jgi:hypothetical protein